MTTQRESLDLAERAFAAQNATETVGHLADALALGPTEPATLAAASQLLQRLPDAVRATAIRDDSPPKRIAVHALALAHAHQFSRAVELLFRVGTADKNTPYLAWVVPWMNTHPSAQLLELAQVGPALTQFADSYEDAIQPTSKWYPNLAAAIDVLDKLAGVFSGQRSLRAIHAKLLRRASRFDDALAMGQRIKQQDPNFGSLLLAWTYRDMDRHRDAIGAFRDAYAVAPDNGILLDVGDLHLFHGEFESAIDIFSRVPQSAPEYPWANASIQAAQHLITRDPRFEQSLAALARQGDGCARTLHAWIHAYAEVHPLPCDLTAGLVRNVQDMFTKNPGQGTPAQPAVLNVNVTSIESPSVFVAFDVAVGLTGAHARLDLTPEKTATPDPRAPLMTALGRGRDPIYDYLPLWRYEGSRPIVNARQPAPDVAQAIASVANTTFDWPAWQQLATARGPTLRGRVADLVSSMVRPPLPADPRRDAVDWVYRYQIAGALLIARLDEGWNTSERRGGLLALAHGPVDWLISAALPSLGLVYAECPEARWEIQQVFGALRERVGDIGYCCYRACLEAVTMRWPDIDEASRRQAFARFVKATQKPFLG